MVGGVSHESSFTNNGPRTASFAVPDLGRFTSGWTEALDRHLSREAFESKSRVAPEPSQGPHRVSGRRRHHEHGAPEAVCVSNAPLSFEALSRRLNERPFALARTDIDTRGDYLCAYPWR